MNKKKANKLRSHFDTLSEIDKWKWIKDNQDTGIVVFLDNDDTYGLIQFGPDGIIFQFDEYLGYDEGVSYLLEAMGIKCAFV